MEITEKWLSEMGGWQAMKSARSLVAAGQVSELKTATGLIQGQVGGGRTRFAAGLRIRSHSDVDNLCTCTTSRRSGQMCEHSIAVGLASMVPPPAKLPTASSGSDRTTPHTALASAKLPESSRPPPVASGEFSVFLPEAILGPATDSRPQTVFLKLDPKGAGESSRLTGWLADHGLPLQSAPLQLPADELNALLSCLVDHPRVLVGKPGKGQHRPLVVTDADLRPELWVEANFSAGRVSVFSTESLPPRPVRVASSCWLFHPESRCLHPWFTDSLSEWTKLTSLLGSTPAKPCVLSLLEWLSLRTKLDHLFTWTLSDEMQSGLRVAPVPARFELEIEGHLQALHLTPWAKWQTHRWRVANADGSSAANDHLFPLQDERIKSIFYVRDVAGERRLIRKLTDADFEFDPRSGGFQLNGAPTVAHFVASVLPRLATECDIIVGPAWERVSRDLRRIAPVVKLGGTQGANPKLAGQGQDKDWLAMEFAYEASDGFRLSRADALRLLRSGVSSYKAPNGKRYLLDLAECEAFEESLQDVPVELSVGGFKTSILYRDYFMPAAERSTLAQTEDRAADLKALRARLPGLGDSLREYQLEGVAWIEQRLVAGQGAVLADDMGLGKTLQSIAAIRLALQRCDDEVPALVVCPKSLIPNWLAELRRFAPDLVCAGVQGPDRQTLFAHAYTNDVLITSYQLIQRDLEWYLGRTFPLVVIDEASFIRNPDTESAKALRSLKADARLALTGTPVENGARDLWSIYQFVLPGYLGGREHFKQRFEKPLEAGLNSADAQTAANRLRRLVRPFFLRRTKAEVLKDLPEKIEQVLWCEMSVPQKEMYRTILDEGRDEIRQAQRKGGGQGARMTMLTVLLRLRQTCCDLRLTGMAQEALAGLPLDDLSGKWPMFQERLEAMLQSGRKVLIFSQFVQYLQYAKDVLEACQIGFCYLDGSTRDRGSEVVRFQQDAEKRAFLISLKAGGYGLNLTAADQVILMDPWWNPAVEAQAIDRAHRFGQTQVVNAYRMVMRGTVEERILALQQTKRGLIAATVEERGAMMGGLTQQDLEDLLKP